MIVLRLKISSETWIWMTRFAGSRAMPKDVDCEDALLFERELHL